MVMKQVCIEQGDTNYESGLESIDAEELWQVKNTHSSLYQTYLENIGKEGNEVK